MRNTNLNFENSRWGNLSKIATGVIVLLGFFPAISLAQQPGQKTFASPEEASKALVTAAQSNDQTAMLDVLGPDGKQIISSGDDVEDQASRANFVKKYQEMHRLVTEPDGTTCLYIGAENWPTPIPIVHKGAAWYFDTEAGTKEIVYRRVGRNELSTIRVCQELVAAQKDFSSRVTTNMRRKSSATKASTMGFIGKPLMELPKVPLGH